MGFNDLLTDIKPQSRTRRADALRPSVELLENPLAKFSRYAHSPIPDRYQDVLLTPANSNPNRQALVVPGVFYGVADKIV